MNKFQQQSKLRPNAKIFIVFAAVVFIVLSASGLLNQLKANPLIFSYAPPITLPKFEQGMIGKQVTFFQEQDVKLSLEEAKERFQGQQIRTSSSDSVSLGIGVRPAWLKFSLVNNDLNDLSYRLAIETPWLDHIDTYLVHNGRLVRHVVGGDALPFEQRPMPYRFYAFEHEYPVGITDVYIRVESVGPMAIPIRFSTSEQAIASDLAAGYQYGVLYGIMLALALYNLVLFVFIRQKEYGLYALYLIGFVLNSLSYTGQIHAVFTPHYGPYFQDWVDIFLMITYSVAGLHFARLLLNTQSYAPRLDKLIIRVTQIIPAGMIVGLIFDQLVFSMLLAFVLNCGFVTLFIAMGIYAHKAGKAFAITFLISSVTAAVCITVSTLAVAGLLIPYNDYTFKAIEVGMALEAILLAVILAQQFRMAKLDKLLAESYARCDTLTRLNNRFGFNAVVNPIWQNIVREKRDAAVMIFDIDDFKSINDTYGHSAGDKALMQVAHCIESTKRSGDVSARWGGEEFIIFLPETSSEQALAQAERLRKSLVNMVIDVGDGITFRLSASFGIAGSHEAQFEDSLLTKIDIEHMINQADKALYQAKNCGKNQVQLSGVLAQI